MGSLEGCKIILNKEAWVPEVVVVVGEEVLSWHASSRDLKISDPSLYSAPYNVLS